MGSEFREFLFASGGSLGLPVSPAPRLKNEVGCPSSQGQGIVCADGARLSLEMHGEGVGTSRPSRRLGPTENFGVHSGSGEASENKGSCSLGAICAGCGHGHVVWALGGGLQLVDYSSCGCVWHTVGAQDLGLTPGGAGAAAVGGRAMGSVSQTPSPSLWPGHGLGAAALVRRAGLPPCVSLVKKRALTDRRCSLPG